MVTAAQRVAAMAGGSRPSIVSIVFVVLFVDINDIDRCYTPKDRTLNVPDTREKVQNHSKRCFVMIHEGLTPFRHRLASSEL